MSLKTLKKDFHTMLHLKGEIEKCSEMLIHHSNLLDKKNYNAEKCERIERKIKELESKYYLLYEKWFKD